LRRWSDGKQDNEPIFAGSARARGSAGFRAREGSFLAVGDGNFDCREDRLHNALGETINGLYKAEVVHRRGPWRTFEAVEFATLEWVDWFNNRRLLEPIGFIPPAEAEDSVPSTNRKGSNGSDTSHWLGSGLWCKRWRSSQLGAWKSPWITQQAPHSKSRERLCI
jgi:Integrase core domain